MFLSPIGSGTKVDYKIPRSLRFRAGAQCNLYRTPTVNSTNLNRQKWTFSAWIKRGMINTSRACGLIQCGTNGTDDTALYFVGDVQLQFFNRSGATLNGNIVSGAYFRDPTAWMHVVAVWDSTNATANDRMILYVNGVRLALQSSAPPTQNTLSEWNSQFRVHRIGAIETGAQFFYDGYMAEIYHIEEQALPPTAFGRFDLDTNVWGPKRYTGNYGTNGFYLDFADNSTLPAYGTDRSGMSNLLYYSDSFSYTGANGWARGGTPTVTAGIGDPFGGTNAYALAIAGGTANPYLYAQFTPTIGTPHTVTVYGKAGVLSQLRVQNGNNNGGQAVVNLLTGAIISSGNLGTGTGTAVTVENAGSLWWKISVTTTHTTASADNVLIQVADASTTNAQSLVLFRASRVSGGVPSELLYTNGAPLANKNWTPYGFGTPAAGTPLGINNDSATDSPTNYGVDTGIGGEVRGNYAAVNVLDCNDACGIGNGGGYSASGIVNLWAASRATVWLTPGRWYWEFYVYMSGTSYQMHGIMGPYTVLCGPNGTYPGNQVDSYGYYNNGQKYTNAVNSAYGAAYTTGDIIGVAYDAFNGQLTFYKNGVSQGVAFTAATYANGGRYAPSWGTYTTDGASSVHVNFGTRPFNYPAPAGFKCLCTQNLPEPSIKRGDDYFMTNTRTGTGAVASVTGQRFAPGLVWIKQRSGTQWHSVFDTTRGASNVLWPNEANASAGGAGLTAFNADGFTLNANPDVNASGSSYIDWMWKKGAVPGVDVVNYTGTGTPMSMTHSLGAPPMLMLIKSRSNPFNWIVYYAVLGPNQYLTFDAASAAATASGLFSPVPTSTHFSVGGSEWGGVNTPAATYTAFLFTRVEGFSAIDWYYSNQLANGPYFYTGFRPRWVMIKNWSVAASWSAHDTARDPVNPCQFVFLTSEPNAEAGGTFKYDILSNGIKLRIASDPNANINNGHLVLAFAEHPFKYARAR